MSSASNQVASLAKSAPPKYRPPPTSRLSAANAPSCTSVSRPSARKRLPALASGKSSAICSGVSTISFSGADTRPSSRWLDKRRPHWNGSKHSSHAGGRDEGARAPASSASWRYCIGRRRRTSRAPANIRAAPTSRAPNRLLGTADNLITQRRPPAGGGRDLLRRTCRPRSARRGATPPRRPRRGPLCPAWRRPEAWLRALRARLCDVGHNRPLRTARTTRSLAMKPVASSATPGHQFSRRAVLLRHRHPRHRHDSYFMAFNGFCYAFWHRL